MPESFIVSMIEAPDERILGAVEQLLGELYEFMGQRGLMIPLAPDGVQKWRQGVASSLGRFGVLVIARQSSDDRIVGFTQGMLRRVPDYLGSEWVGHIPHAYVTPDCRGTGCGGQMVDALMEWFGRNGVKSVELQVVVGNTQAVDFWERKGFISELIQLRRRLRS